MIAKQKKRELRAKQARDRARRLKEEENAESQFDVEKDENFNADDGEFKEQLLFHHYIECVHYVPHFER